MSEVTITDADRAECAAEWDYLLNKTFSTPMAIEHLAQFVVSHRTTAIAERDARITELEQKLAEMIDLAHGYAEYIASVPSAELERHPYLPGVEIVINEARAALKEIEQ